MAPRTASATTSPIAQPVEPHCQERAGEVSPDALGPKRSLGDVVLTLPDTPIGGIIGSGGGGHDDHCSNLYGHKPGVPDNRRA